MFASLREKLKGWKTIIWARLLIVLGLLAGALVPILQAFTSDTVSALIPPQYQPFAPLILSVIGVVTEALRHVTTGPVGAKGDDPPPLGIKAGD